MKRRAMLRIIFAAVLMTAAASFGKDNPVTFHGVVVDSQCAYNVHAKGRSHEMMIKGGVEGASDEKSCTLHCVKQLGGSYVLAVKDDVYRLDDQDIPEKFAGDKVKVTGTLDVKSGTIHVVKIEREQESTPK